MTHPPRDKRVLNFWLVLLGTVLALLVLWANAGAGQAPLQQVKSIEIRVHGAPGHARAYEAMARDLIQFSTGDLYSPALVSQAVSRLTESGLFSHIHVPDPVLDKGAVQVAFALTPFGRVKDIRLSGAFPLFRKELLNVMTLYIGDAFSLERLEAQVPRIAKLYAREGFPSPHIAVRGEKDSKDGNYTVFIHVDKGDYLRVAAVDFSGNAHVSSSRLKLRLKTWRASVLFGHARRFIRKDMAGDVKNLVAFYRKKGFADVRVIPDVKVGGHEVRITYQIDEGLRYRVAFQGNDSIWTYTLKKDMVLAREGNRNNLGLRKSLRQVRRTYRDRGFSDVRLSHETRTAKDEAQVLVVVDQGRQYRVASVRIQGNPTIPEQEIRASMLTSEPGFWGGGTYVARHLDNDIKAIRALYQREGFARTRVKKRVALHLPGAEDPSDPLGVNIFLDITEGVRTRVDQVSFSGLSALSGQAAMELISLKPGEPFRPYMVENDEKNLQQAVSELGYPRVRVRASQQMTPNHEGVTLDFHVDQGGFVRVGQIFYMGNFRTRSRVLDQELVLKTGDPLSLKKLLESRGIFWMWRPWIRPGSGPWAWNGRPMRSILWWKWLNSPPIILMPAQVTIPAATCISTPGSAIKIFWAKTWT